MNDIHELVNEMGKEKLLRYKKIFYKHGFKEDNFISLFNDYLEQLNVDSKGYRRMSTNSFDEFLYKVKHC